MSGKNFIKAKVAISGAKNYGKFIISKRKKTFLKTAHEIWTIWKIKESAFESEYIYLKHIAIQISLYPFNAYRIRAAKKQHPQPNFIADTCSTVRDRAVHHSSRSFNMNVCTKSSYSQVFVHNLCESFLVLTRISTRNYAIRTYILPSDGINVRRTLSIYLICAKRYYYSCMGETRADLHIKLNVHQNKLGSKISRISTENRTKFTCENCRTAYLV